MNIKKHVLIISFAYPPLNYIGAFRVSKISKHLMELGYEPHVITARHGKLDVQAPIEIPKENIHYVEWNDPYSIVNFFLSKKSKPLIVVGKILRLFIPFGSTRLPEIRRQFWRRPAERKALEIIEKYPITAIYSSSSPPASAIIASRLAKKTAIPWLAEFRDPWTQNKYNKKNWLHQWIEEKIEKRTLKHAHKLITVSRPLAEEMEEMHKKETLVVYNGFDPKDYEGLQRQFTEKFTIIHTGSIYKGKRDPSPLFEAISILEARGCKFLSNIEIHFYGARLENTLKPIIDKYNVEKYVFLKGMLSKDEIHTIQFSASILLLLAWNHSDAKGTLTGKIFEYIGVQRPILAIAYKDGAINNVLDEYGGGYLSNEPIDIANFLERALELWSGGDYSCNLNIVNEKCQEYTRMRQTTMIIQGIEKSVDE